MREAQAGGALRSDIKVVPLRQAMLGALNWTVEWFDPGKCNRRGYYTLPAFTDLIIKLLLDGISANDSAPEIT